LNVFRKVLPKESCQDQQEEGIEGKIRRAYQKMKKRALAREKFASGETRSGNQN
jgi:hypothetical protein